MSRLLSAPAQGHLAMLLFSSLVAGSFSLGAMMANEVSPAAFTAIRFCLGALCIWLLARSLGSFDASALRHKPWRYAVLGGMFGFYFVLMFEGLKTAPPVSAAAMFTLVPLMSAGFAWVLMRQILTGQIALALLIGGIGALWVIFRADLSAFLGFEIGRGEGVYFIGCIAHALYTPMVRHLNRGESVIMFSLGTLVAGGILLLIYSAPAIVATDWLALPPIVWITLIYVGLFATAGSTMLLQFATLRLPSAKVMAYTYLVPTWVIVWEIALGNGAPGPLVLIGVAMTVLALLLLLRPDAPNIATGSRTS